VPEKQKERSEIRWLERELKNAEEHEWPGKLLPGFARRKQQACFGNSQQLVLERSGLRYAEGQAWQDGMLWPVHHAWVINEAGLVIDTTWTDRKRANRVYRAAVTASPSELTGHLSGRTHYDPYLCCMSDWCFCINLLGRED
jgi:hypothetical protein